MMTRFNIIFLCTVLISCTSYSSYKPISPPIFNLVPASFDNGYFIPLSDTSVKDRTACLLTINNYCFDTISIVENTTICDSISALNPNTFIKFSRNDSSNIISIGYLTNFGISTIKVSKGSSKKALLLNLRR